MPAVAMTARIPSSRPLSERQGDVHLPLAVAWVILCLLLPGVSCQDGGRTGQDAPCRAPADSMLLSPLIAAGQIDLAQERSRVRCLRGGDDLESYSGFISVDRPDCGSHLFFWFFPAQEQPRKAPLLLWLNGGPGRSSLYGAMFENGPYQLTEPVSESVMKRNVTWVKYFSMLYVDNPLGAGLSHTSKCSSSTLEESTSNLYSFLQQFFLLFPQFSPNDFYIGGQSYAGKYVPSLGYYIHQQMNTDDKPRMRLKGFYIGSGFCDPETEVEDELSAGETGSVPVLESQSGSCENSCKRMFPEVPETLYTIGVYSDFDRRQHRQATINGWSKPGHNPFYPDEKTFWDVMDYYGIQKDTFRISPYDYRQVLTEGVDLDYKLYKFLSNSSVREALNAGGMKAFPRVRPSLYSPADSIKGVRREMGVLLDHYKVLHYTGNMDVIVNVRMTEAFLMATPWSGQAAYNNSQRFPWFHEGRLAGFVTKVHNFTRVVIRNAGHDAPADQPEWTLAMMQRFVTDQPFTHQLNNAGL